MDLPWRHDKYCYMLHLAPLSSRIHAHMHTGTHTPFKSIQMSCHPQWGQDNCFFLIITSSLLIINSHKGIKLIVQSSVLLTDTHPLIPAQQNISMNSLSHGQLVTHVPIFWPLTVACSTSHSNWFDFENACFSAKTFHFNPLRYSHDWQTNELIRGRRQTHHPSCFHSVVEDK